VRGVLIVDDESSVRELLLRWLAPFDYSLHEAVDAESAISVLETIPVSVVLCDLSMPGRGGEWLVSEIRERFPTVAIVLATGDDAVPPRVSIQRGVVGYLVKPFNRSDTVSCVGDAVAWHRAASGKAQRERERGRGCT
jgi:DNA-binding NtrC family response regulator